MIIKEYDKQFLTDLNFTSVKLTGYEIPYYVKKECYCDKIVSPSQASIKYYEQSGRFGQRINFKIFSNLVANMALLTFNIRDLNGIVVNSGNVGSLRNVEAKNGTWYYVFIDLIYDAVTFGLGKYTVELVYNGVVLASSNIESVSDIEGFLFFNFWNGKDLYDFPFTSTQYSEFGDSFLVEGGIKIGDLKSTVDQETFRDQRFNPKTLSAYPRKTATLTIGGTKGVPEYVGNIINAILSCEKVYVNGVKIGRSGDSVPEPSIIFNDYPLVNFTCEVEIIPTPPNIFSVYTEIYN